MKKSQREKAVCVAHSILTSLGLDPKPGEGGADFMVNGLPVSVGDTKGLVLDGNALATNEFNKLREEGDWIAKFFGKDPLVFRVNESKSRISNDDYEGKILRLTQFKRTLNPPESVLKKFEPIVKKEAARAAKLYANTLHKISQDVNDLQSIGMIFAVNYWWQYAKEKNEDSVNYYLFVFNLRQQFSRWNKVTRDKLNNIDSSLIGVPSDQYNSTPIHSNGLKTVLTVSEDEIQRDMAYEVDMEGQLDLIRTMRAQEPKAAFRTLEQAILNHNGTPQFESPKERRGEAKANLEAKLGALPHDEFVERLTEITDSMFTDHSAKKLAKKKLKLHKADCNLCVKEAT